MKPKIHSHIGPRQQRPLNLKADDVAAWRDLGRLGICLSRVSDMQRHLSGAFDANDVGVNPSPLPGVTTATVTTPVQFLQAWLPGFVTMVTAPRKIDELIGVTTIGSFEDEEIVQGVLEHLGESVPYSDYGNVPLASFNTGFERRTIVRQELGFSVGKLEELRTGRVRLSAAAEKRAAAARALEIQRNRIGFYGFNDGANRTFGFLNDPALPAYVTVAAGASGGTQWATKTFLEITADIRAWLADLRAASKGVIDPQAASITIALPETAVDYLGVTSDFGVSVRDWLSKTYPNVRFVSAPELIDANGGATAVYVYAETVDDGSSDNSRVFEQFVPAKFITLGVDRDAKSYIEDFANATAGVLLKRPYAVRRFTGV
ncbi:MAG: DUF2184 domain-containing protein [Zoogloeaceae bacterium]|jgi:hypothetical protein|nr:DUF2184 domain-containing protein [Zoogloeaceae bacterium]